MFMCRVVSCVVGKGCLLCPVCFLDKTLLAFVLLHFVFQGQLACYSKYLLTSYICIPIPYNEKDIFFFLSVSSRRSCRSSQSYSTSASLASVVGAQTWITVMFNGLPWKQTEIILSFLILYPSTAFGLLCFLCRLLCFF